MDMEWYWALTTLIGMVMFFMAMGVPVALTFITTNIVGVLIFMGSIEGWTQIVDNSTSLITRFTLGPVPMFIMMGALFFHTGLAIRVFDGLDVLFGRLRGRLCYLTVAGGAFIDPHRSCCLRCAGSNDIGLGISSVDVRCNPHLS